MTRRNPPIAAAPRRERRTRDRRSAWEKEFGLPDAATLERWRAELVARRGYPRDVAPGYLAAARRTGEWRGGVDWRTAPDAEVAWQWRTFEDWAVNGRPPRGYDVLLALMGGDHARLNAALAEEIARRKAAGRWDEDDD